MAKKIDIKTCKDIEAGLADLHAAMQEKFPGYHIAYYPYATNQKGEKGGTWFAYKKATTHEQYGHFHYMCHGYMEGSWSETSKGVDVVTSKCVKRPMKVYDTMWEMYTHMLSQAEIKRLEDLEKEKEEHYANSKPGNYGAVQCFAALMFLGVIAIMFIS